MDSERWRQVEDLYNAVLAREPGQRAGLLGQADPEVRREVELLLAQEGSLLDRPAWEGTGSLLETETVVTSGKRLGPYEIEHLLGAGGMGEVYRALDTGLGRTIAIKVLSPSWAADPAKETASAKNGTARAQANRTPPRAGPANCSPAVSAVYK